MQRGGACRDRHRPTAAAGLHVQLDLAGCWVRHPDTASLDGIACASVACLLLVAVLLGILSGTGCDTAPARTASPRPSVSISPEAQQAIAQARAAAASRTGVEAGKLYAQVLTPGYLITLEAGSRRLVYHSGAGRVVYCKG